MMKKRVWSILLTLIIVIGLLPVTALAAEATYDIWVKDVQVDSDNAANVLGDGTVAYDEVTNTLTLKDAVIETTGDYGIKAYQNLNIKLVGTNRVRAEDDGIYVYGDLTISGAGSLALSGPDDGIYVDGGLSVSGVGALSIEVDDDAVSVVDGDIVIADTKLTVDAGYWGFYSDDGDVEVTDSDVKIVSEEDAIYAYYGDVEITGSNVEIESYSDCGIYADYGDVEIAGSAVEIEASYQGIYTCYGDVTAKDCELTISSENSEGIYTGYGDVYIFGCKMNFDVEEDGIYANDGKVTIVDTTGLIAHDWSAAYGAEGYALIGTRIAGSNSADGPWTSYTEDIGSYLGDDYYYIKFVLDEDVCDIYSDFEIWVGNVQVTVSNMDDVLGDGTVSYDPASNELTLNGADIKLEYDYGIYAEQALNLVIKGENTIMANCGIYVEDHDLTVSGSGSLGITAEDNGIYVGYYERYDGCGIDLTVSGVALKISAGSDGIVAYGDVVIADSTLDITAEEGDGIYAEYNIDITDSTMKITSEADDGICADYGDLVISGSELYVNAGDDAVYVPYGNVTVSDSSGEIFHDCCAIYGEYGVNLIDCKVQGRNSEAEEWVDFTPESYYIDEYPYVKLISLGFDVPGNNDGDDETGIVGGFGLDLLLSGIAGGVAGSNPFVDVPADAWYHDAVVDVYKQGLMSGTDYNKFDPNATTTRAMIVTILWRLEGSPMGVEASGFSDNDLNSWYGYAVEWAAAFDIVEGADGKFSPNAPITREQLAAILFRYAKYKGYDVWYAQAELGGFSDAASVSGYATEAMEWAVGEGLITGANEALMPGGSATRAQVAAILSRFLSK